jgi:hypothetical protein
MQNEWVRHLKTSSPPVINYVFLKKLQGRKKRELLRLIREFMIGIPMMLLIFAGFHNYIS